MPKLKTGEQITWKEALARFKKGVEDITPLQKIENEVRGTFITLLGYVLSFGFVIFLRSKIGLLAYGLILIFLGASITTGVKFLGLLQQLKFFKALPTAVRGINDLLLEGGSETNVS